MKKIKDTRSLTRKRKQATCNTGILEAIDFGTFAEEKIGKLMRKNDIEIRFS